MQIAAFFTSAVTGSEIEYVLAVEDGAAEWRNAQTGRRLLESPQWRANQLESLDWFARVYADMNARFVLR
jgi:hypothetical protein